MSMKLPAFVKPAMIGSELVAVVAAALIFAYMQRNSATLRGWLNTTPNPPNP